MSQRHGNCYGFVKTGLKQQKRKQFYYPRSKMIHVEKKLNWVPFWRPLDFEGGPKIEHFWKKLKNDKKEVQEAALKKHDLLIDV